MAENKKSFVLYVDQKEIFRALTVEQAGMLINHIYDYVSDNNPVCDDPIVNIAFIPIKQQLKRDLKKWESLQEQRQAAGKASAESRKRNSTTVNDRSISCPVNVNGTVNVNDSVNDNVIKEKWDKEKRKRFTAPSIEEVKEYILERKNGVDAQKWFDHYTSNGWMVGKNKMKDWKAAVRTWEKNDFGNSGTKNKSGFDIKDSRYVPDPDKFETF